MGSTNFIHPDEQKAQVGGILGKIFACYGKHLQYASG